MFVPRKFAVDDLQALDRLVGRDAFVTLVSVHEGAPFATHLPALYARDGGRVSFRGHWARANPQWRDIETQTTLLIVHGPHAYVSPTWYEHPNESVPTWNYAAAHVYGRITLVHETQALSAIVADTAAHYESMIGSHWRFPESAPGTGAELAGIVGFDFVAERIQIKHKLNQHHTRANVEGAIRGLRERGDTGSAEVAELMADAVLRRQP